jgi:DNA processing protein
MSVPATWHQLVEHFGSAQEALDNLPDLVQRAGAGRRIRLFSQEDALAILDKTNRAGWLLADAGRS